MNKREWYKRRNIKNLKNRTKKKLAKKAQKTRIHKRNYIQKQLSIQQNEKKIIEQNGNYKIPFKIPKIFSLVDNPNETIMTFLIISYNTLEINIIKETDYSLI